jgi:orotidine-5'-phosphate decarboxylase
LRAHGYNLIDELHARGLKVFADLKLNDIPNTMASDGRLLREANPYIVTAMCSAGYAGLSALKAEIPETEVLGVTALTSLKDEDTRAMFSCSTTEAVLRFANQAHMADIQGLISSPAELAMLVEEFDLIFSLNTPGIRRAWAAVKGDDQNASRVMTPADAIRAGADRIVVGRPITRAANPLDAVRRTLDEIDAARV